MAFGTILSFLSLRQSDVVLGKSHPYSPANAPITGFKPNEGPLWATLAPFAAITTVVLGATVLLARRRNPGVKSLFALGWFTLCEFPTPTHDDVLGVYEIFPGANLLSTKAAFLHCVLEGEMIPSWVRAGG
jgi:hypothetical protein